MQAKKKIETPFHKYKKDFCNLIDIAISHFNLPFAAIDIFEKGKKKRIASSDFTDTNIDKEFYSSLNFYKKPVLVPDILSDALPVHDPFLEEGTDVRFYASAPLFTKDEILIGTFTVTDNKPNYLDHKQLVFLQALANQAARIVELERSKEINDALKNRMEQIIFKIAHDIRNPLGALKNIIELQHSGLLTEQEANDMLPILLNETNRIVDLTHIIANWGAILIKNSDEYKKPLYLKYLADEQCKNINQVYAEKKNTIINAIDERMLINTNEEQLNFIFQQLLSNASKFTSNGNIVITATNTDTRQFIKVTDNGVGISPQQLEKINSSKEFINTKGTNKESGSGMGLFLIKELLKESGKKLAVRSEVGKGTEVLVEI